MKNFFLRKIRRNNRKRNVAGRCKVYHVKFLRDILWKIMVITCVYSNRKEKASKTNKFTEGFVKYLKTVSRKNENFLYSLRKTY